eukprot:647984-Pleurochrysis_carterae.AAC.1
MTVASSPRGPGTWPVERRRRYGGPDVEAAVGLMVVERQMTISGSGWIGSRRLIDRCWAGCWRDDGSLRGQHVHLLRYRGQT